MKKKCAARAPARLILCLILALSLPAGSALALPAPDLAPYGDVAVYMYEVQTGKVLLDVNGTARHAPASLAKMLTAAVALETAGPSDKVTVTAGMLASVLPDSSLARLVAGEVLTVEQLVYAMLLPSGNDAARVMAVHCGRIILGRADAADREATEAFVAAMNAKASSIGLTDSRFSNPDGYPEPGTYSTARDMARLTAYARTIPVIAGASSCPSLTVRTNMARHEWTNTNRLITGSASSNPYYDPRVSGMKTGSGDVSDGRMLAFYASEPGGVAVAGAVLHLLASTGESTFDCAGDAVDYAFDGFRIVRLLNADNSSLSMTVSNSTLYLGLPVTLHAASSGVACVPAELAEGITSRVAAEPGAAEMNGESLRLSASLKPGDTVAWLVFESSGEEVARIPMIAAASFRSAGAADAAAYPAILLTALAAVRRARRASKKGRARRISQIRRKSDAHN